MFLVFLTTVLSAFAHDTGAPHEECVVPEGALLPDLVTVVPKQLQLWDQQQGELLRFSNGMANLGEGLWMQEPEIGLVDDGSITTQGAYQVFMDRITGVSGQPLPASDLDGYLGRCEVGQFDFHPTHNHWHIGSAADYRVCTRADFDANRAAGNSPGSCTALGGSQKVTFCLIDWVKLGGNNPASDPYRNFFTCWSSFQGVGPGFFDQYHHSTDYQSVDISGVPNGDYVLVSTVVPDGNFIEGEGSTPETGLGVNNAAWVYFTLEPQGNGNRVVTVTGDACDETDFRERLEVDVYEYLSYVADKPDHPDYGASPIPLVLDMCGGVKTNR